MPNRDRIERIIAAGISAAKISEARHRIEDIRLCDLGYAEAGYNNPVGGVVAFGNWNTIDVWNKAERKYTTLDDTPGRVGSLLEKAGVTLEWSDEWECCEQCGRAVRTSPDSYAWKASYAEIDGSIRCCDCISEDPTEFLNTHEGECRRCVTFYLDMDAQGYVLLESGFEHGFYGGQNADPKVIGDSLQDLGIQRFLFVLDSSGQFDVQFSVWVHRSEMAKIDHDAWSAVQKDGSDVAEGMRRALHDASSKMAQLPKNGVKVARCDASTATATARTVSPQEFVEGKALD